MLELAKKRDHKGNVALYLIIVNAVLKITETDLDLHCFCTLVIHPLFISVYQGEESIPVFLLIYLLVKTS